MTGDLLLDGEVENATQMKSILDTLEYPYFVIAGNHDYIPANPENRREGFSYLTIDEFVKTFKGHGYDNAAEVRELLSSYAKAAPVDNIQL